MSTTLVIAGIVFVFCSAGFFIYKQLKNINQNQVRFHNRMNELEKGLQTFSSVLSRNQARPVQTKKQEVQAQQPEDEEIVIEQVPNESDETAEQKKED